jgi:hypothetical protein
VQHSILVLHQQQSTTSQILLLWFHHLLQLWLSLLLLHLVFITLDTPLQDITTIDLHQNHIDLLISIITIVAIITIKEDKT